MFCMKYTNHLADITTSQMRPLIIPIRPTSILRCLYVCTPLVSTIHVALIQFFPFSAPCINLLKHHEINDQKYVDFNGACFMMLMKDLPALFEIMVHLGLRLYECFYQIWIFILKIWNDLPFIFKGYDYRGVFNIILTPWTIFLHLLNIDTLNWCGLKCS